MAHLLGHGGSLGFDERSFQAPYRELIVYAALPVLIVCGIIERRREPYEVTGGKASMQRVCELKSGAFHTRPLCKEPAIGGWHASCTFVCGEFAIMRHLLLLPAVALFTSACTKEPMTSANSPSSSDPNQASPESSEQGRSTEEVDGKTEDRMGPASPGGAEPMPATGSAPPPP